MAYQMSSRFFFLVLIGIFLHISPLVLARKEGEEKFKFERIYIVPSKGNNTAHSDTLLVTCVDFRLIDEAQSFMKKLELVDHYDEVVVPGASLSIANTPIKMGVPEGPYQWGNSSREFMEACKILHQGIKRIIILDHENCGAFKGAYRDEAIPMPEKPHGVPNCAMDSLHTLPEIERERHKDQMVKAYQSIQQWVDDWKGKPYGFEDTGLNIYTYIMHTDGAVENWTEEVKQRYLQGVQEASRVISIDKSS